MNEANTQRTGFSLRSRPALAATLALVVLGSAGFAAAGGIEMVRNWVITVEVEGPDGPITLELEQVDIQTDGEATTISLDTADIEGITEGTRVTMTATGSPGGGSVTTVTDAEGNVGQATTTQRDD